MTDNEINMAYALLKAFPLAQLARSASAINCGDPLRPKPRGADPNNWRASLAMGSVESIALHTGCMEDPIDNRVVDLLVNLRHLCDAEGLDYADMDRRAKDLHIDERHDLPMATKAYEDYL